VPCRYECGASRGSVRWGALIGSAAAAFLVAAAAVAGFNSSTTGGAMTVSSKKIFPGTRSTSAWTLRDASGGGAETNADDALSYADATVKTTSNWSSAFAANRYLEFDFNGAQPGGISVSTATFNFRMAANSAGDTACFYIAVYRASTSALLATYGSSGSPIACNSTVVQTTYTQSIASAVTSSTILDDLRVRVYGNESANRPMKVDLATVTGSTAYGSYTAYEQIYRDQASGTAATTNWAVAIAGDGTNYQTASTWSSSFSTLRYLKFTFDPAVPAGSVITSASVDFYYRSVTAGNTACWYMETYNGVTLLGTHGSSVTPISCNTGNTTYSTDNVPLSEITTVANANSLTIKVYMRESGNRRTQIDFARLNLDYYLD
jgi:hypothetical protein